MSREIIDFLKSDKLITNVTARSIDSKHALKFIKMFETAICKSPELLKCSRESITVAAYTLAELDLSPIAAHGQAYLIPYKTTCQLQIGWRGLIAMALRDGGVRSIAAHVVYNHDTFVMELGLEPKLIHKVDIDGSREDPEIRAVYAIAVLADGSSIFEVMSKTDIDKIRVNARSGETWKKHYGEMARKTVVKRLCKYLPVSTKFLEALEIDSTLSEKETVATKEKTLTQQLKEDIIQTPKDISDAFYEEVDIPTSQEREEV